ncbi:MAG: cation-translocating P-type ATPase [Pirellulales bacterium]
MTVHELYHVPGLDCPEELALIERGLRRLSGVGTVSADYVGRTLRVEFDPALVESAAVVRTLEETGFPGQPALAVVAPLETGAPPIRRSLVIAAGLLAAAFVAWGFESWRYGVWLSGGLAIASTLVAGLPVGRAGWRSLRQGAFDMNVLVTVAAAGAIAIGYTFEAATAMLLFDFSLWLESASLGRARRAIQSLLALEPPIAHRFEAGGVHDVSADALRPGDRMLIKPGERIAADGAVVAGASTVDEATLTGESLPVEKRAGARVFAGTLNGSGSLEVVVERAAAESTLAHIARLVQQAQASRSATQRFVDRFARIYTPVVMVLALLVTVVPPLAVSWGLPGASELFGTATWINWIHRGLVLLVTACPCALVISTPVTIVCGLHRAARLGMVVKGGEHLENAARLDTIVFDKTGTLTTGKFRVERIDPAPGHTPEQVLAVAAALEAQSEHPLAAGIVQAAQERGLTLPAATEFQARRGLGIEGVIEGRRYRVGNAELHEQNGRDVPASAANGDGSTAAIVADDRGPLGTLWLADTPRPEAATAMRELRTLGVSRLLLMTGDAAPAAQRVASAAGIEQFEASLLPEDKIRRIQELTAGGARVAMVGDGVNDAPALAAATLGVALGAQASATALETADVVIMAANLERVPALVSLGRQVRRILAQNIALSLGLKLIVLLLATAGMASMWLAVLADVGTSLVVIGNGMRLVRARK